MALVTSSLKALPPEEAWTVFSPEAVARVLPSRWSQQAASFLGASLTVVQTITAPDGGIPDTASLEVDIAPWDRPAEVTRVNVRTFVLSAVPHALRAAGDAGAAALGGAGMDALLARTQRVWQVRRTLVGGSDPRAPLVMAAVLASVLLGPVLPPDEVTVYGVRGARMRLEALGWRT